MNNLKIYAIIFIVFLSYPFTNVFGQELKLAPNNLKFKHFSTKDGLSQSSVIAILQDRKGYLWFGTRDGLNKYDGNRFITYRHNSEDKNSLSHSWITAIFEDSLGNLWVGTKDGLNKYSAKNDDFKRYKHAVDSESISDNEIWDLTQLNNSELWVATNNGIDKIEIRTDNVSHFKHSKNDNNSISDNRIRCFLKLKEGSLFVATIEGLDVFNPSTNSFKHNTYPENVVKEQHINNSPTLYEDRNGNVWLGYSNGLALYNENKSKFETYKINNAAIVSSSVRSICEGNENNLWIGAYTGLFILNHKNEQVNHFRHNENDSKSLSQNSIYKILEDSRGDIWIGTWAGGINFFDRSYDDFKLFSAGTNNRMLNYKVISSIVENSEDEFWIGTEGGGINIFNKKTGFFSYYKNNVNNLNSLSSNNVKSMLKDHNGNFWIGTHDGGLNFLDPTKKPFKFEHFENTNSVKFNIRDYRILTIFEDRNYNIWIGTLTGGLIKYNIKTKEFIKLENDLKSVTTIVQGNGLDEIIVGGSKGIEKVNISTNEMNPINYSAKESSLNKSVNCIYIDNDVFWIGTEGQGLYEYNTLTNTTEKYGISDGLPNEVVYGILPYNKSLWISTNGGISKFNLQSKNFKNFDESDGLQGNEFNYKSYLKTSNDELMFGGTNGLNYFNPNDIVENNFIPLVDIYSIKISNKEVLKLTDSIKKIELKYNQNDFSLDFTTLSYSQPNKNNYAYKLVGFDKDWNHIGNNKTATYTNLDEGNYVFRVKASNNNGLWNEKGDSIKISILSAPWRTWWAYFGYFIIMSILFFYFRKLALIRIREKNELKQEKQEKEQLEEVNKLKLQLFTNISHDFRTPLTLIVGPIEQLLKQKNNNFVSRNLETIHRNSNILLQLINELLDFRKSEAGKMQLFASKNNIIPFIENIKLTFEELAIQRNINYKLTTSNEHIEVWFDRIKLKKVLFNILSNAFKFTLNNDNLFVNVSTELFENKNHLKIDIINFGRVIPKEHIDFIFDRFYQLKQKGVQTGTGIGLSLSKKLVELHKGKIAVKSSEVNGTCFSIYLPLGNYHLSETECVNEIEEHTSDSFFEKPAFVQKELLEQELKIKKSVADSNEDLPIVLIVEDHHEVRNFIKNIFVTKYKVFEVENGEKAINIAKENPIDIIISDVMMPVMDGFELCKRIKTDVSTSHIPIILLTAKTSDIHRKEGYILGADAYITKPFDTNVLELRVDNILNSRKNLVSKFKKEIILEPKELSVTTADEKFLKKAIEIVESNISNIDFNVNLFTNQMHMSRSVLFRKIKALTGQSISTFIRTIRLKRAGQLLVQTKMNISEIAYEVGFNDLKYFRNCFKKLFNEKPSEYRSNNSSSNKES